MNVSVKNIFISAMIVGIFSLISQPIYSAEVGDIQQANVDKAVVTELPTKLGYKSISKKTRDKKIEAGRIAFFEALGSKVFLKAFDPLAYTIKYVEYASLKDPHMVRRTVLNYSNMTVDEVLFQGAKGKGSRGMYQKIVESPRRKKGDSRAEDHSLVQTYLDGFNMIWKFEKDADVATFAAYLHDVFEKAGVMPEAGHEPLLIIYSRGRSSDLVVPERVNGFLNKYFTVITCADLELIEFILSQHEAMLDRTTDVYSHPKVTYLNDNLADSVFRGLDSEFMDFKQTYYVNKLTKNIAADVTKDVIKALIVGAIAAAFYKTAELVQEAVKGPQPKKEKADLSAVVKELKELKAVMSNKGGNV